MTGGSYVELLLLLNFTNYIVLFRYNIYEHVFAILMLMWCHDLKLNKFLEKKNFCLSVPPNAFGPLGLLPNCSVGFPASLFCVSISSCIHVALILENVQN